ncbi:MAG TPA: precorrin-6A synthase (deacetylating) [Pseudonocardia sp.]|jgi:precorrin-6A synthase
MRTLLVIGIGAGDPEQLTVQAVNALNMVDVFFVFGSEDGSAGRFDARRAVCERYVRQPRYRMVAVGDPARDRRAPDYPSAVRDWRDRRASALGQAIETELPDGGVGAILVWGDPSFYDGTIQTIDTLVRRGQLELDYRVIPGIGSISALAAKHRITLNQVAGSVHITTARRLADDPAPGADDVVVMLNPASTELPIAGLADSGDWHIYWGANLGTAHEALVSGPLNEVLEHINQVRREHRQRAGWLMDTYLLRRTLA